MCLINFNFTVEILQNADDGCRKGQWDRRRLKPRPETVVKENGKKLSVAQYCKSANFYRRQRVR